MFDKLKDWRHIHNRYDRCAHTFFSTICIAATVILWLPQRVPSLHGFSMPAPIRDDVTYADEIFIRER